MNKRKKTRKTAKSNKNGEKTEKKPMQMAFLSPYMLYISIPMLLVYVLLAATTNIFNLTEGLLYEVFGSIRLFILTAGLLFTTTGLFGYITNAEARKSFHSSLRRSFKGK